MYPFGKHNPWFCVSSGLVYFLGWCIPWVSLPLVLVHPLVWHILSVGVLLELVYSLDWCIPWACISRALTYPFGYCTHLFISSLALVFILACVFPRLVYPSRWCVLWVGLPLELVFTLVWYIPFPCLTLFFPTISIFVFRLLIAYKNILCAVENFSIATVYGLYYFGRGRLGLESFSMYVHYDSLAQDYLVATQHFSLIIHEDYRTFQQSFQLFDNMTAR